MMPPPEKRWRRLLVALTVVGLVSAGCGGGGGKAGKGPKNPATGTPILLGMINQENAPVGSFPEVRQGVQAAARYLNEERKGVGGHPLQVEVCTTSGTPESSQGCANRLLERHPVAVIGGVDLGAAASLPVLERAGIPYVGGSPNTGEELTSKTAFMLSGGTAADLLGQGVYVTDKLHAKRVSVLYVELPGLLAAAPALARTALKKKGVDDVKLVTEKADAADFTPALTEAVSNKPQVVAAVFPAQGCSRVMQAKESLGVTAKMFYPSACAEQSVIDAGAGGAEDAYFSASYVNYEDTSNNDVKTYRDKLKAYGGDAEPSLLSETGFSVLMNVAQLLGETNGQFTSAALTARLKASKNHPSFMGHAFTCDGKQVPIAVAACSVYVRILQYRNGGFHDVVADWVNGASLIKLVK